MKLLLTSNGLSNNSIANALFDLVGKPPEEITLCFIPTASNVEQGNKDWFIEDLLNLYKQKFKSIEIVDISVVDEHIWRPAFDRADVLFFEGGNTYHLMHWLNKTNLTEELKELLENKAYVGVSAGSMVTNPNLNLKMSKIIYEEDMTETEEIAGLNFVNFYFLPHLNSKWFPKVRKENISEITKSMKRKIYALDDDSAIKIDGDKLEIVSEGNWEEFN